MAGQWKMCHLGHWYRDEKHCPTCSEDELIVDSDVQARPSDVLPGTVR